MSKRSRQHTITLKAELLTVLRRKAARMKRSLPRFVNKAECTEMSEDASDLATAVERRSEPTVTLAELLDELKANRRE